MVTSQLKASSSWLKARIWTKKQNKTLAIYFCAGAFFSRGAVCDVTVTDVRIIIMYNKVIARVGSWGARYPPL